MRRRRKKWDENMTNRLNFKTIRISSESEKKKGNFNICSIFHEQPRIRMNFKKSLSDLWIIVYNSIQLRVHLMNDTNIVIAIRKQHSLCIDLTNVRRILMSVTHGLWFGFHKRRYKIISMSRTLISFTFKLRIDFFREWIVLNSLISNFSSY